MASDSIDPEIVAFAKEFAGTEDQKRFHEQVLGRYTEATLIRLLVDLANLDVRRAAVLALGELGTYQANSVVARALSDDDEVVRGLAQHAIWEIWYRADTAENNALLQQVRSLITSGEPDRALDLATSLIERAPRFAEAYNQRAVAYFLLDEWHKSIDDCKKALELNPHHFGAQSGIGHAYIRLGDHAQAILALQQAMRMNQNLHFLQLVIDSLRASES